MTATDHLIQVQQVVQVHGGDKAIQLVDPVTQETCDVTIETRIGPGGVVFFALVPVVAAVQEG